MDSEPLDLRADPSIALLFTDIVMPGGMNGYDLAREAKRLRPDIAILLTSGFSEASLQAANPGETNLPRLSKPYRKSELARAVSDVLNAHGG